MIEFDKILNEQQLQGVHKTEGAVLVIAGAGSGKTRVLTYRIAYLINNLEVSPYRILAITFTNKAAKEMKGRLEQICPNINGVWVSTFHSFCARVLRNHIDKLGYDKNYTIYDELEANRVIKRILTNKHMEPQNYVNNCRWHISEAKNQGLSPLQYSNVCCDSNAALYCDVYAAYEEELHNNNALDYDDLLLKTVTLFGMYPEVALSYSERFQYIHIDEYQDTNKMQYTLIKLLAQFNGNLFAVGDEDQSIYGWRGADITNIINFKKDYPEALIIKLEQNYRSTGNILRASNALISFNRDRYGKVLWTADGDGENVVIRRLGSDGEEADFVVREIAAGISRGANPSDFAILLRLNALTNKLEERLTSYAIPYKVFAGQKFYERKEIKDVLAYCRILSNPRDNDAMLRIINTPKRGIGDTVINSLCEYAAANSLSISDVLFGDLYSTGLAPAAIKKLSVFVTLYSELFNASVNMPISEIVKTIIERAGFALLYSGEDEDNYNRRLNLDELLNGIREYEKVNQGATLGEFLQSVSLISDSDEIQNDNYVTLATVHAVKGLEFNTVFIIGLEENVFPCNVSSKSDKDIEEERRVMYVAMTRAQKKLYITNAWTRFRFGKTEQNSESRFLDEIKRKLLGENYKRVQQEARNQALQQRSRASLPSFSSTPQQAAQPEKYVQQYSESASNESVSSVRLGQKVKHKKFGIGTVISANGENVAVAFDGGVGVKRLNLRFAPLEIIN